MTQIEIRHQGMVAYRTMLLLSVVNVGIACFGHALPDAIFLFSMLIINVAMILCLVRTRFHIAEWIVEGDAVRSEDLRNTVRDSMTGAYTRHAFLKKLGSSVHHGSRSTVGLYLIDVDHFKAINDSFGHGVGDTVLKHLVEIAATAFPKGFVSRLGGDEFAILTDGKEASRLAEIFLSRLRIPVTTAGRQVSISASIGIATSPNHSVFGDELIVCADLALYESKRRGRGTFTVFDETMMADQKYRRHVERELRAAVILDEFELYYQPVVSDAGKIIGVEALVRWRHPVRGLLTPADFIGIAEQSTLIDEIGEWVLRRACRDAVSLPGKLIGINVSAAQLKRDAFLEMVIKVLAETGCSANRFTFEITESVALSASDAVLGRLHLLRSMGARISLDDFGTGNFGFSSLLTLPVDSIKVDRFYIQTMGTNGIARILVATLGAIGRAKAISVVAEGIENKDQLQLAKAAGCTAFQGYLLGRPVPLPDLLRE